MNKRTILAATLAAVAAVGSTVIATAPAEASGSHRIVFKAFGSPARATVETWGKDDITRFRSLPYRTAERNSEWSQFMSVQTSGYRYVGCAIYVDGILRARDTSNYGIASCYVNTMR